MTEPTEKIKEIIVRDFEKNEINLIQRYEGKRLLAIIYNNSCLGCTGRAIPLAYDFMQDDENLEVIGIHSNFNGETISEADIKSIFTSGEIPFPIFLDNDHKVYDQFLSEGTPQWLLINSDGSLNRTFFGSQAGSQNRLMYALENLI